MSHREIEIPILDEEGRVESHVQWDLEDVEVPTDVEVSLLHHGVITPGEARTLNLSKLLDLLTEDETWKK